MEEQLKQKFSDLDEKAVLDLVKKGIDDKIDPQVILSACQEAMRIVGEKFEQGVFFISDLMLSGFLFKQVSEQLSPLIKSDGTGTSKGKIVVGTVKGDIHDIGKDLVIALLEANNFEVIDLGVDQPKETFIEKIKESGAKIVGLSGLLTIAFDAMKETVEAIEAEGIRDDIKIMIGGGPVNQGVCDFVGADHWANNAQGAVSFCLEHYSA